MFGPPRDREGLDHSAGRGRGSSAPADVTHLGRTSEVQVVEALPLGGAAEGGGVVVGEVVGVGSAIGRGIQIDGGRAGHIESAGGVREIGHIPRCSADGDGGGGGCGGD